MEENFARFCSGAWPPELETDVWSSGGHNLGPANDIPLNMSREAPELM
jgi:hypothetical protein